MKTMFRKIALVLSMMCIIAFASPVVVLHAQSLDDLSSGSSSSSVDQGSGNDSGSISDYLKGYNPVTDENMQQASSMASPIVSFLGTVAGFIVMVASAGIFVVTALDLCYIGLPFTRSLLNPSYGASQGGASPMGGLGMGMPGAMGGGTQGAAPEQGLRRRWVSDEAVACVSMAQQSSQPQGGMPQMGAMGMMGGGMIQQSQPAPAKSVITTYLKKRAFFLVIFTVATVVLMSSLFTDCGLNLAELLNKIMDKFNGQISNVNI